MTFTAPAAADQRHFEDATLRGVHFIDDKEGWSVGDEGVVWHTLDGGQSWVRQPTGVRASLRSVCFLTSEIGWIVGREESSFGASSGVLLFTRDGGLKWQRLLPGALPGLNQVRFIDSANGHLLGDGTDQLPSGLFRTTDGGRTWEPVPGPRTTTWYAGEFVANGQGILGGGWARLGKLRASKFSVTDDVDRAIGRDILGVHSLPGITIAVARGGMVLTSVSEGSKWGYAKLGLPPELLACLDFHAVHGVGKHAWIVGRPGAVILHTDDAGQSWQVQKTGSPLPLHGVCFFNDRVGWAVGDAGTILATTDGGATWKVQRQGGQRAAMLVVQARAEDLPLDTLALVGAAKGYLATVLRAVTADPASSAHATATDRMRHAAAARLGGALTGESLWAFALPQHLEGATREQVLAYWNHRHASDAPQELLRQLVLALRIWRPNVVLGDHPQCKDACSSLVAEALQEAVRQAADPKIFPEQLEQLGLRAWQAGSVYALSDKANATIVQNNDELLDALEGSPRDHAMAAAVVLSDRSVIVPHERGCRLMQTQVKGTDDQRDLMKGVAAKVGEARREMKSRALDPELARALREKAEMLTLAETLEDREALKSRLDPMLTKLPDDHAALALSSIAAESLRRGRWDLAHAANSMLVDRYPTHPLSAAACRWLIRHDTSSEVRRRYELKHTTRASDVPLQPSAPGANSTQPASHIEQAARPALQNSLALGKRLAGFGVLASSDPSTQFCLQSARRAMGDAAAAKTWFGNFAGYVPNGPWHQAALGELWLTGAPATPRRLARCRLTNVRPYLDGEFDDPCWQNVKPLVLDNAVGDTAREYNTQALFAYDQEFLYLAVKCRHPQGQHVAPVKTRQRDADIEPYDRISLMLDLDRDYATYFHLQIDQRGCVRDDCWGELSWNPRWYVAVKSGDDCWQVEVAIPLVELTSQRIPLNSAWAFNLVRILPGRGVQSWSQPADVRPRPEGMSLLLFQQDTERAQAQPAQGPR
jgi:photosystem II stability/assembly factor-like uncharacterized protein